MGTELQTQQPAPPAVQIRETVATIKARVQMVQHAMRDVMKKDVHYGQIPGTPKPTLYKPGAEIIALAFGFAPRYVVDDLSTGDSIRYRVTCELHSRESGGFIGSGQGEASSDEEKYKWRRAVCTEEFDETPEDRKRVKWAKGKGGSTYTVQQVRTEPADIANTVLKMAEKRSFIDAIRTTTGCSDMFSQDLEDLPAEVREGMTGNREAPAPKPLGEEGWKKLVAQAERFGFDAEDLLANAAALGYEGAGPGMPRELAKALYRALRDSAPRRAQEAAGDVTDASAGQGSVEASGDVRSEKPSTNNDRNGDQAPGMDAEEYRESEAAPQAKTPTQAAMEFADAAAKRRAMKPIGRRDVNMVYTQATVHDVGDEELSTWLAEHIGVETVEEIPQVRLDEVVAYLKGVAA